VNSTCYRIVFNKHRGQLMAVAETASSCTKGATGESSPVQTATKTSSEQPNFTFRALSLFLWGAFVFGGNAVAQVVADPSAPANQRPTILKDAQGRPLVNIQTPSAAGLSRNTYTQFDVPTGGVVLNNSSSNPWMSNGVFAKTILNEVNSTSASQIKGAVRFLFFPCSRL
jgi:filamentous hemagglutinin